MQDAPPPTATPKSRGSRIREKKKEGIEASKYATPGATADPGIANPNTPPAPQTAKPGRHHHGD